MSGILVSLATWAAAASAGAALQEQPSPVASLVGVPEGWRVVARAQGDLNNDGVEDVAMVLKADRVAIETPPKADQPYRLIVALTQRDRRPRMVVDDQRLIEAPGSSDGSADPFTTDGLKIVHGNLEISRELLRGHYRYRFRWQAGGFRLIGYDYTGSDGHCITEQSIDYLTGRATIAIGPNDESRPTRRGVLRSRDRVLPTLDRVGRDDWYPEGGFTGRIPVCALD